MGLDFLGPSRFHVSTIIDFETQSRYCLKTYCKGPRVQIVGC